MNHRLLLVHAHPDDEVTTTGLTMAKAVAEGHQVTLVTCTLGEEGEVLVEDLAHLASGDTDSLGSHRISELDAAMKALGVTDYLRLGADGLYRDSGMDVDDQGRVIPAQAQAEHSFWNADLLDAANHLVGVIRDRRPEVMITYDPIGNYGHPDHIQAHRVAHYAAMLAAVPTHRPDLGEPWQIQRTLWSAMSKSWMHNIVTALKERQVSDSWSAMDPDNLPPFVRSDAEIAVTVSAPEFAEQKLDAFRAHATQIAADSQFFTMANVLGTQVWSREWFLYAGGVPLPEGATDIFVGL